MWRSSLSKVLSHTPQKAMQRCLVASKVPSGPLGLAPIRARLSHPGDMHPGDQLLCIAAFEVVGKAQGGTTSCQGSNICEMRMCLVPGQCHAPARARIPRSTFTGGAQGPSQGALILAFAIFCVIAWIKSDIHCSQKLSLRSCPSAAARSHSDQITLTNVSGNLWNPIILKMRASESQCIACRLEGLQCSKGLCKAL